MRVLSTMTSLWSILRTMTPLLFCLGVVESDDKGNVARRDFSLPVASVMLASKAVRMEDSSGFPLDRVRRLRLFSGVDP